MSLSLMSPGSVLSSVNVMTYFSEQAMNSLPLTDTVTLVRSSFDTADTSETEGMKKECVYGDASSFSVHVWSVRIHSGKDSSLDEEATVSVDVCVQRMLRERDG